MELTINHRNALLAELEAAQADRDLQKKCLDNEIGKEDKCQENIEWYELTHWLALSKIETIKSAISKNEIDY